MEKIKNPFAVRNGKQIMIGDLDTDNERGIYCRCKCPNCNGDFIARMGDVRIHHFAHTKNACDEIIAYISGLYGHLKQALEEKNFFIPELVISCRLSKDIVLDETNIEKYTEIINKKNNSENEILVCEKAYIKFDNMKIYNDDKNSIQAIEVFYKKKNMAIKIKPPKTLCKSFSISKHKDIATLVIDLSNDASSIQNMDSNTFQEYLLSEKSCKYWIFNPKIKEIYHEIFIKSRKTCEEQQEYIKIQQTSKTRKNTLFHTIKSNNKNKIEALAIGYEQVKERKFETEVDQIRDSFNNRWVKCKICGKIKPSNDFWVYGGKGEENMGKCYSCKSNINF